MKKAIEANKALRGEIEKLLEPAYGFVSVRQAATAAGTNYEVMRSLLATMATDRSNTFGRPTTTGKSSKDTLAWIEENVREISREEVIANLQRILSKL